MTTTTQTSQGNKLIFLGLILFLLGLLIGLFIPVLVSPRMGLSGHLEGTMNGMFLMITGVIWKRLALSKGWLNAAWWLVVYGTYSNFIGVSIGAATGAGKYMPLAGGKEGAKLPEMLVGFFLITCALTMLLVCIVLLAGVYRHIKLSDKIVYH